MSEEVKRKSIRECVSNDLGKRVRECVSND